MREQVYCELILQKYLFIYFLYFHLRSILVEHVYGYVIKLNRQFNVLYKENLRHCLIIQTHLQVFR